MFCRAPAAVLLRGLTLTVAKAQVAPMLDAIASSVFVETLHELTISSVHVSPPLVEASALVKLVRLRRLALRGAYIVTPATVPRITHLMVAPTTYDVAHLASIVELRCPDVTDFVLDYANMATPHLEPEVLAAIFDACPRLARLELRAVDDDLAAYTRRHAARHAGVTVVTR